MKQLLKVAFIVCSLVAFSLLLYFLAKGHDVPLLQTKGPVATAERNLMITAFALMLTVVIPVFIMTAFFAWRYRAGNRKAAYAPNWDHSFIEEFIWWAVPCTIVFALAILAWRSSHQLDPFRPIINEKPPITIQVIALNWKWLFIYPEHGIASVNFVEFPVGTPIEFRITSDAPMNSFWIPALSGQIYAMPGMVSQLHLVADESGEYSGSSANISGKGFAGMRFIARAVPEDEFKQWVMSHYSSDVSLDEDSYSLLARESIDHPVSYYVLSGFPIFDMAVNKYMMPTGALTNQMQNH